MISRQNFLKKVIDDYQNKGNNFNHIAAMNIITITNNLDTAYDFILNTMINKNKQMTVVGRIL